MSLFLFIFLLVLSLWKECTFLFLVTFFAIFGIHPLIALLVGLIIYISLRIGERIYESKQPKS